jgi:hypothetical protein
MMDHAVQPTILAKRNAANIGSGGCGLGNRGRGESKRAFNGPAFALIEDRPDCCQMGMHTVQCKFHLRNHGVAQNRDE